MHEEYKAITDAGFILQLDRAAVSADGAVEAMDEGVEVLNHALQGIPEDRVRYHHCWS